MLTLVYTGLGTTSYARHVIVWQLTQFDLTLRQTFQGRTERRSFHRSNVDYSGKIGIAGGRCGWLQQRDTTKTGVSDDEREMVYIVLVQRGVYCELLLVWDRKVSWEQLERFWKKKHKRSSIINRIVEISKISWVRSWHFRWNIIIYQWKTSVFIVLS